MEYISVDLLKKIYTKGVINIKYQNKDELVEIICPSKEIREYWKSINYDLTILQIAILLVHSVNYFPFSMQIKLIKDMIDIALDKETKTILSNFLSKAEETLAFFKISEPDCVFEVISVDDSFIYKNPEKATEGLAFDYETALLIKDKCDLHVTEIIKRKIFFNGNYDGDDGIIGTITYTENGEISSIYGTEIGKSYRDEIPNFYVSLPHPFHKGDVVRNVNTGKFGVITSGPIEGEDFFAFEGNFKWKQEYEPLVVIEYLGEDNIIYHKHCDPTILESVSKEASHKLYEQYLKAKED